MTIATIEPKKHYCVRQQRKYYPDGRKKISWVCDRCGMLRYFKVSANRRKKPDVKIYHGPFTHEAWHENMPEELRLVK